MKNETVIGIIGNTHGVKIAASPNPNAVNRNVPNPSVAEDDDDDEVEADEGDEGAPNVPGFTSLYPAGATNAAIAGAAGSIANVNAAVFFLGGRQVVSLQT